MGRVVSNDVSAIQPEIFEPMVQVPLYKSLVALELCNVHSIDGGDTFYHRRFGDLSAQTYSPGTPLSATNQDWAMDAIYVSTTKHVTFYVDDTQKVTIDIDQARELAGEAAYRLRDAIDSFVFNRITGSEGFDSYQADDGGLLGGTAHRPISAGSANIINLFAGARKLLLERNVEQMGDWCAVVTPKIASYIEIKAANAGFDVADATLKNGYAGNFMGFEVYVSNNLPSGKCSAIAPTISAGAMSATTCKSIYFGRKGMIDLYLAPPKLTVRPCEDKIGTNYITYATYGAGVVTKNRKRGLNVAVQEGYY